MVICVHEIEDSRFETFAFVTNFFENKINGQYINLDTHCDHEGE